MLVEWLCEGWSRRWWQLNDHERWHHNASRWHNLDRRHHKASGWHNLDRRHHNAGRWHDLDRRHHNAARWHNLDRRHHNASRWHDDDKRQHKATRWHNLDRRHHNASRWHHNASRWHHDDCGRCWSYNDGRWLNTCSGPANCRYKFPPQWHALPRQWRHQHRSGRQQPDSPNRIDQYQYRSQHDLDLRQRNSMLRFMARQESPARNTHYKSDGCRRRRPVSQYVRFIHGT